MLASRIGGCIRHSLLNINISPPTTVTSLSLVTTQPPDTIRAPMHEDEDAIDGVVHAGTETAVTTSCRSRLHRSCHRTRDQAASFPSTCPPPT